MENRNYSVGGHCFELSFMADTFFAQWVDNYQPFEVKEVCSAPIFRLTVTQELEVVDTFRQLGQFDEDNALIGVYESAENYRYTIGEPHSGVSSEMVVTKDYSEAQIVLAGNESERQFGLNNALMMLYAFAAAPFQTLLIHSSVVVKEGRGYAFLGKSGTGKSTHSRMWLENIEGTELLNDDNPALRIAPDGVVWVYGTPWSGKTPCYRNLEYPLGAVVRIKRAAENRLLGCSTIQSFASLKPTCSNATWDAKVERAVCDTIAQIAAKNVVFTMECLPNGDAARVCFQGVCNG